MEQQWYVICTKSGKEKKVVSALNKKGIENYCPFTITEIKNVSRISREYGPLFRSYIFVKTQKDDLKQLKKLPYVVNPLFWKNEPAVINNDEINAIRMMCESYSAIRLERSAIMLTEKISVVEKSVTNYNNHTATIQHQGISIVLPTLGYTISAEREKKKESIIKAEKKIVERSMGWRFNPLFFLGINL